VSILDRFLKKKGRAARNRSAVSVDLFDEEFLKRLETLSLMSRRAMSGSSRGERRSKKRGSGVEFADHRSYVPGDDIRFLDVGVYQRFGKLLIRLFEEEEDLSLYFLIDTSASMGMDGSRKLNQAIRVAAALSYIGLSGLDRVSLVAVGQNVQQRLPPLRGKRQVFRVLRFLSGLLAEGETDLAQACRTFAAQNKRRGLAVVLSDLFDPHGFEAGINVLRFNQFEPVVLHLTDSREHDLPESGDLSVTDVETGMQREVSMTPALRTRLRTALQERTDQVARFCTSRGVAYFAVDVEKPFDEVVLSVLRRGGFLR
jgi:uncharacterized protein (DUF58 family)